MKCLPHIIPIIWAFWTLPFSYLLAGFMDIDIQRWKTAFQILCSNSPVAGGQRFGSVLQDCTALPIHWLEISQQAASHRLAPIPWVLGRPSTECSNMFTISWGSTPFLRNRECNSEIYKHKSWEAGVVVISTSGFFEDWNSLVCSSQMHTNWLL